MNVVCTTQRWLDSDSMLVIGARRWDQSVPHRGGWKVNVGMVSVPHRGMFDLDSMVVIGAQGRDQSVPHRGSLKGNI